MNDTKAPDLPPLPLAYEYIYGWSGAHRSLSYNRWNGMAPDTSETVYTRDQMHAYLLADRASRSVAEDRPHEKTVIGLDYDGTITRDPDMWYAVMKTMQAHGHEVHIVTMRHGVESLMGGSPMEQRFLDDANGVHFTGNSTTGDRDAKRPHMDAKGIEVHVWIDDNPKAVHMSAKEIWGWCTQPGDPMLHSAPEVAAPKVEAPAVAPSGWREVFAEARKGLDDATPSAFDNSGYRDYAAAVLDSVEDELSALVAAPAVAPSEPVRDAAQALVNAWPTGYSRTTHEAMDALRVTLSAQASATPPQPASPDLGECDECGTAYSFDPTDGGSICVRCMRDKLDRFAAAPASSDVAKMVEEAKEHLAAATKAAATGHAGITRAIQEEECRARIDALGASATQAKAAQPAQASGAGVAGEPHPDCPNAFVCAGRCSGDRCADAMAPAAHPTPAPAAVQEPEAGK